MREILALTARPGVISFAGGLPAPELFDAAGLREAFAAALSDERAGRSLQYSTTEGDPELRAAIAARLTARGLTDRGRRAARHERLAAGAHAGRRRADRARRPRAGGGAVLPGGAAGVRAGRRRASSRSRATATGSIPTRWPPRPPSTARALLYTIPTFHNPTGRTLPLERRRALAAIAERHGLWLIEDDPYGELRYRGEPLPSLATMAEDRTLALSTLSKVAAPGLRIGWVRTPPALRHALVVAKQAADLHSSTVDQAAAARWLGAVDLDAHIGVLRAEYGRRRDALLDGLLDALPPGSTHNRPEGGMFVWARLPGGWDAEPLLARALERDVAFVPGYPFFAGEPDRATLRFSFTTHAPAEIAEGLARLRSAWQ